ncbi:MAG: oxidoreductase, FAD-binding [Pseudomonas sp.]|nr:oxidoreductase, FAD-binding [Pseudomonas sp.]
MFIDYQVAVVGAGIIGASIAAKLASLGVRVALIDKGTVGSLGASGYSGGLVRLFDPDPLLMDLAARSIALLDDAPFANVYTRALRRTGMVYRAAPDQREQVERAIGRYASARYPMRVLGADELARFNLGVSDRIDLYEAHACIGDVRFATAALAGLVRRTGLVLEHCELKALEIRSPEAAHLSVGDMTLRCQAVVIATGAWSQRWLPQAGLETRSIPLARVATDKEWSLPVIDAATHSYGIPLTRTVVQTGCGVRHMAHMPEDLPLPDAWHAQDACARVEQLSACRQTHVLDVLPGFDGYSPDGLPLLGFGDADSPVYLATGMSGLGFKLAPAVAQIAAEQLHARLTGAEPGQDWSALSPVRLMPSRAIASVQP